MIYYDITEGRANTRLPPSIVNMGKPVVGLELATAADLVISPRGDGLAGNVNRMPGSGQLPLYLEYAMLVQRKTGSDMVNSIPELTKILYRMRIVGDELNAMYWLLVCGKFENYMGKVVVDGRTTGWNWSSLQGAFEAWQWLGGHISVQPTDDDCAAVIERWERNVEKAAQSAKEGVLPRPKVQSLALERNPWRATLMTLPHIGEVMSVRIANHCGRLVDSLVWLTNPESYGVPGIGQKIIEDIREYMGMKPDERLFVIGEPTFHGPETEEVDDSESVDF